MTKEEQLDRIAHTIADRASWQVSLHLEQYKTLPYTLRRDAFAELLYKELKSFDYVTGTETDIVLRSALEVMDAAFRNLVRVDMGRRIRELRLERGMSVDELAALSNLKAYNIDKIESGRYNFTLDTLAAIAGAFGCKLDII